MAAPTTNFKPFCGIGIYRAPEGCPREEFEANMRGFLDIMQSTPAVQKNLLKLNAVYQNDHLKEAVDRAGLKEAPTTVLAIAECKAAEDFANCMKDVDVTGHVRNTNSFGMPQAACFFSADVVTKLDHGKCLTGEKRPAMGSSSSRFPRVTTRT
ncbi:hypothetical protein C8F01DRAFT_191586 [Mycena amicta]|nr:hypothetical protein C8F01DRAFT_191586 [Mycena amicta]